MGNLKCGPPLKALPAHVDNEGHLSHLRERFGITRFLVLTVNRIGTSGFGSDRTTPLFSYLHF